MINETFVFSLQHLFQGKVTSSDNQVVGAAGVANSAGVTGSQKGE